MNYEEMKKGKSSEELAEFASSIISGEFSDHLLEAAEKINSRYPSGAARSKAIFPKLAGSYLDLDHPALFYAKVITKVKFKVKYLNLSFNTRLRSSQPTKQSPKISVRSGEICFAFWACPSLRRRHCGLSLDQN